MYFIYTDLCSPQMTTETEVINRGHVLVYHMTGTYGNLMLLINNTVKLPYNELLFNEILYR